MENDCTPCEIMRHPECQRISRLLTQRSRICIVGNSGCGKTMFVKAHCDLFWKRSLWINVDSDDVSSAELLEQYHIRDGMYEVVIIDFLHSWSKICARHFLQRVPVQTRVVLICSSSKHLEDVIVSEKVQNTDPQVLFQFFMTNHHRFPYFHTHALKFMKDFQRARAVFGRLIHQYRFGCAVVDDPDIDMFKIKTLNDSIDMIDQNPEFRVDLFGTIEWQAFASEMNSFANIDYIDIFGYAERRKIIRDTLLGSVWFMGLHFNGV